MPIHDQSYRRYAGRRESAKSAWTVIALAGIGSYLKRRAFVGLLIFSWLPFLVRAVQIWTATNFGQAASFLATDTRTFRGFLDQQGFFVFVMTVWVGAGLIASDRRANALQIYLSKPLTRTDYIAGKLAILIFFLLLVTLVPGLLLIVLQVLLAGNFDFIRAHLFLFPAMTLGSLIIVLVASITMLALSSLSTSTRYVAVLYAGVSLFSDAMFAVLRGVTGSTRMSWLSFPGTINQLVDLVFRLPLRYETPVAVSAIVAVGLVAVSLSVLERRVRGVEVVT